MRKHTILITLILCFFQKIDAQNISSTNFEISTTTFTNTNTVPKSYLVRFEIDKDTLVLVDSFDSNCLPITSFEYKLIGTDSIEVIPYYNGTPQYSYDCLFGSSAPLTSYRIKYKLTPSIPLTNKTIIYRCNNYNVIIKNQYEAIIEKDYHLHQQFTFTMNEDLEHPLCSSQFEIIGSKLYFICSTLESQICNMLCYSTEMKNDSLSLKFQSPCASICDMAYTANCYTVEIADTSNFTSLDIEFNNQWYHVERQAQALSYSPQIPNFAGVLPITGLEIKVKQENKHNIIQWSTLTEENVSHFEILKSLNGKDFVKIGILNATGNSTSKKYYSFTDNEFVNQTVYYKLKAVDIDGKYTESKIVTVDYNNVEEINIFPNPSNNVINIKLPTTSEYLLNISNSLGKVILSSTIQSYYKIEHKALIPGIYFMTILDTETGISTNHKIIILE